MAADVLLPARLADVIPTGLTLRVYHLSTRPATTTALFSAIPDQVEQETQCESHLLSIALPPSNDIEEDLLVFAIEVLVFTTNSLTTIFVSKADSSGYLDLLNIPKTATSVVKAISTTFLQFLVDSRLDGPHVVLSLFARSQNQYLFPGSVECSGKHVLDDRQLIKWWCRTLDPIVRRTDIQKGPQVDANDTTAFVIVPGCDEAETKTFFPATARSDPLQHAKWRATYPVDLLAPIQDAPPRCLVPRLPDDPKARFLTDLDGGVTENGQWRNVKTLDHFWEMMAYRQECSAGRLVGFIWVVFLRQNKPQSSAGPNRRTASIKEYVSKGLKPDLPTPIHSQANGAASIIALDAAPPDLEPISLPGTPPPSSPILQPQPEQSELESNDAGAKLAGVVDEEVQPSLNLNSETTPSQLIITADQYQVLVDHLLQLDFSTRADALQGSRSFLTKAAEMAGNEWGETITGRKQKTPSASSPLAATETGVNILTGIRKKRKAIAVDPSPPKSTQAETTAVTLPDGLVRKKPKN